MLKATLRSAVLLGLVALGVMAASMPSFAEVQNVKVSGDITVRSFFRNNLDLHQTDDATANANSLTEGILDGDFFIMQTTGINISADLTENVSAMVRIANERNWDLPASSSDVGDVSLSQAYITLRELFYSPLTVRIGTQPIRWGRGFILGSNLLPSVTGTGTTRLSSIGANEFTDFTAFDAIRATLDLSGAAAVNLPVTIDALYIKGREGAIGTPDDVDIMGVNVGTKIDAANSEVEGYYINKRDKNTDAVSVAIADNEGENDGSVSTIGVRGSAKPVEGSNVYGELAYQFGHRNTDPAGLLVPGDSQQAWAFDLGADYTLAGVPASPTIGGEWRFYSGKDIHGGVAGWAPVAPGYFTTALREFQTGSTTSGFYPNDQDCFAAGSSTGTTPCTASQTNQHELAVYGSLKPIEDLTIAPRLSWFFTDVGLLPQNSGNANNRIGSRKNYIGMEWDTMVTYNYTDDVQFGVLYAVFAPGNVYRAPTDNTAQELMTSVSVKF